MKPVVVLAALLSTVLGSACAPKAPSTPIARLAYQHEMVSLDPHAHDDSVTGSVLSGVYECLVSLSPGRTVQPALARRWTTPDDLTWRFWLNPEVLFHDGTPLTADEVVASVRRARFSAGSALATYLEAVEDVRVVPGDESVVEIVTSAPFPLLLTRLAMVAIVPRQFEPSSPVGTGPYRWVAGSAKGPILLRRWERYWDSPPTAEDVSIRFIANEDALEDQVRAQGLDVVSMSSQDFIRTHTITHPWRLIGLPSAATTILGLNLTMPPMDDPRVREAVDLAVDRRALVALAFAGGGAEPAGCLAPATVFGHMPGPPPTAADRVAARRLLDAAGVARGHDLELVYSAIYRPVIDFLVASLAEVGLEVVAREVPFEAFYRRIEDGDNQLYLFGWNFGFADASDFLDAVAHSRDRERRLGLLNGSRYASLEVDRWIEEAAREPRETQRLELLRNALAQVQSERCYLPLFYHSRFALVRSPFSLEETGRAWVVPQAITLAPTG